MSDENSLRHEFEKEWGGLPSQFEVDENGCYEDHTIDLAWDMYLLATQKREREIEKLKQDKLKLARALEFYANINSWEEHDKEGYFFPYHMAVKNDQEFYKHLETYFGGTKARRALEEVFGNRIFFFDPFKEEDILR